MTEHLLASLRDAAVGVARGVRDDQLRLATPCEGFDVGELVLHWLAHCHAHAVTLVAGVMPGDDPWGMRELGDDADATDSLVRRIDELVDVLGRPGITEGSAKSGMPNLTVWRIAVAELGIHAWDLAVATGQAFVVDEWTGRLVLDATTAIQRGAWLEGNFADPVTPEPGASALEQAVAVSGRDPRWARLWLAERAGESKPSTRLFLPRSGIQVRRA